MRRQRGGTFPLGCLSFAKSVSWEGEKNLFSQTKVQRRLHPVIPLPVSLLIAAPPAHSLPLSSNTRPGPEKMTVIPFAAGSSRSQRTPG